MVGCDEDTPGLYDFSYQSLAEAISRYSDDRWSILACECVATMAHLPEEYESLMVFMHLLMHTRCER